MRKLVMGCAVMGMIALSPKSEARSPALPVLVPMRHCLNPVTHQTQPTCEVGWASWYGSERQGMSTASGEVFDQNVLTAAHRHLPFGTVVRVTNLRNRQSSLVRITDRGPGPRSRVIDVSAAAARELGFLEAGLARVEIEIVSYPKNCMRSIAGSRTPRPN
jgi:rare lipoprotein A